MQLDNTRIAVRERGMIDTYDLTLHVIRSFGPRLIPALLIGIFPFALLNEALLYPVTLPLDETDWMSAINNPFGVMRYAWWQFVLIWFQAPAATVFGEAYLGGAVFKQEKTLWQCVKEVFSISHPSTSPGGKPEAGPLIPFFVCQMLMRGTLVVMILPLFAYVGVGEFNPIVDVLIPMLMFVVVGSLRAFRPYINEIIVLEKNPLSSKSGSMTVGKRSAFLHNNSAGELLGQWFGACLVAIVFFNIVFWSMFLVYGVMFGEFNVYGWVTDHILRPMAMWAVVAYMGVARFLSYLDLRIRQEGWEVELLIRAEASRFTETLV